MTRDVAVDPASQDGPGATADVAREGRAGTLPGHPAPGGTEAATPTPGRGA
jgi:hypothetical protein